MNILMNIKNIMLDMLIFAHIHTITIRKDLNKKN